MWRTLLFLATAAVPAVAAQEAADPRSSPTSDDVVEEVLVLGEIPGPPIWKVAKDDHALWILGYPEWVPAGLPWRSELVEHVLADSTEYLSYLGWVVTVDPLNVLKRARVLRQFRRMRQIPDRGTLNDLLPEDLYELFLQTQLLYAPKRDDLGRLRPSEAAKELFDSAARSAGLERGSRTIRRAIQKRARKHGLKEVTAVISQRVEDSDLLDAMAETSAGAEQTCLQVRLQTLDDRLEGLTRLAEAWAGGDLASIRAHPGDRATEVCSRRRLSSRPEVWIEIESRIWALWHDNVDRALSNNAATFAILPLEDLLRGDGPLSRLRQRGYEVRVL